MTDPIPSPMRRLRAYRRALGISQRALAERAGYAREEVCQWELGRRSIKLHQFEDLLGALGVRMELVPSASSTDSINAMTDDRQQ